MNSSIHTSLDSVKWNQYVQEIPSHSFYQLWGWKTVIEESFGHKFITLCLLEGERVLGVLPLVLMKSRLFGRFLISLPFLNYGGPLVSEESYLDSMLKASIEIGEREKVQFIEIRQAMPNCEDWIAKSHKVTFFLDLPKSSGDLWKSLKDKVRNQIRKAEKSECTFHEGHGFLDSFYEVFSENMRDLGTPVYSKAFFKSMLKEFPKEAQIAVVQAGGKTIAAGFTFSYKGCLEIPWASSLYRYHRMNANMFLYWNIIKGGCEKGVDFFDFGRCSPDSGPYNFKKQWGGREIPITWSYYILGSQKDLPEINPRNPKYKMAVESWKKLPLWLTNRVGPRIVRNIP